MYDPATLSKLSVYRARILADKEAVYDYDSGHRYTYADLDERADRLAWFLTDTLGLRKGDRIGFCANNSMSFIDAFYASCKTGIIVTTYNCLLRESELLCLIENEDPKVIFYSKKFDKAIAAIRRARGIREFVSIDAAPEEDRYCYQNVMEMEAGAEAKFEGHSPDDVQMFIHTGGTTGRPKAAMLTYRSFFYNAISEILTLQLSSNDCAYICLPFFHTAAWNIITLPLLMTGGRIVITERFSPKTALKIIREERPTVFMAVETIYKALAAHPDFATTDLSCYRWMLSGAAPISKETLEFYWNRGVKLINAYGMTEIGPNNLVPPINEMTVEEIRAKWNSVGKPMYFNDVRVVDENGNDVPQGERGELIWKGNLVFAGYWGKPEETAVMVKDGWAHSGDIGYYDEDGFYYICGRLKNMYISGGENIFPLEIEEVIDSHPAVAESCVIGVPDLKWGEVGRALIVLKPDAKLTREEILAHIKTELGSIKIPKYITFIKEIFKNSVGKRDQSAILAKYGRPTEDDN